MGTAMGLCASKPVDKQRKYTDNANGGTTMTQATNAGSHTSSRALPQPPTPTFVGDPSTLVVALYDYSARTNDDLSFKKGDNMFVQDRSDGDWWRAQHANPPHKTGLLVVLFRWPHPGTGVPTLFYNVVIFTASSGWS